MKKAIILSAIFITVLGCQFINSNREDPVVAVKDNDAAMNIAIQEAQRTLYFFIDNFQSPKPDQTYFAIKTRFLYSENNYEHIWLSDLKYSNQQFSGTIGNDPVYVKDLKLGDRVTVNMSDVSDWMIIQDGKLIGGYTIRVLRDKMSIEEQKKFDEEIGFTIDPSATPIPTSTP